MLCYAPHTGRRPWWRGIIRLLLLLLRCKRGRSGRHVRAGRVRWRGGRRGRVVLRVLRVVEFVGPLLAVLCELRAVVVGVVRAEGHPGGAVVGLEAAAAAAACYAAVGGS